ncbi:hypothetical protein AVEN_53479-1 [Araneus ventricosus]|uniref:Uncharacterized protein n=1 Tax=Araneus ventricosus TaxID=182803 RepID=A0A4Y2ABX7_ARAVE|nr:hypothetical protein AVEN_53479-1 [Araneus ventricosus]
MSTGSGTSFPDPITGSVDFGMKRQNSFDVSNPAGSRRINGNPAGSDRIEIGAGLQSLITRQGTINIRLKHIVFLRFKQCYDWRLRIPVS